MPTEPFDPAKFVTTETLLAEIDSLKRFQRTWLARCKELCSFRIPSEFFKVIPDDAWRAMPWGHRVLIALARPIDQIGEIIKPDNSQETPDYGWVLSMGELVCDGEARSTPLSGVCPYPHPLHLAGEFIILQKFNARAIPIHLTPPAGVSFKEMPKLVLTSVGEIHFPLVEVREADYSSKQASGLVVPG